GSPQAQDHQAGLHQMCGVQDSGLPEVKPEPARSSAPPEGWVDLPHPEQLVGPIDEYTETVRPGLVTFYSYPKFYRTSSGQLAETVTDLAVSPDPDWDYEVVTGIWTLKVRTDGTFQAIHEGDRFTYRFADLGIGSGDGFRSLQLGSPNWSSYHVVGDTICWNDVFPDLDLKVRYIHDILKVDVIMKEPLIDRIQSQMSVAEVGEDALVTARFEIVEALIFSEARQGQAICDPYNPSLEIDQPLRFVRNGKEVHAIRPAQAFILDEHQAVMDTGTKDIRTAQLWRLSRNGPGVAEMSVYLQDLADAPNGDVLLDPSTTFDPPSRDAFLQEGTSTNWGSATTLSWFYDDRPVLGFDVSSFGTDKVVTSAKLKIYVDLNTNAGDAQARAYNVTTAWDESTVNWYDPWTNDGGDYTTDNQSPVLTIPSEDDVWIEFNVTDAFKARYPSSTSDISSKGYLLRYQSDPGDKIKFCTKEYATVSERPKLEVEYATVSTVVISGGGTDLYSPRSRTITATISPAVSGIPVAFEIIDPDDPADNTTIDASSAGNDNKGAAGSLSPSGSVQTNGSGQAQVTFSTTSMV
ncbi:MAG TPA: DNRLRE domain-containing protein, partial [bacterium]|nr:DNRLRE domain-containing protein [bacterium]